MTKKERNGVAFLLKECKRLLSREALLSYELDGGETLEQTIDATVSKLEE